MVERRIFLAGTWSAIGYTRPVSLTKRSANGSKGIDSLAGGRHEGFEEFPMFI
jgi:hypothetical protein